MELSKMTKFELKALELEVKKELLTRDKNTNLSDLNIDARLLSALVRVNILTLEDLMNRSNEDLTTIRNIGKSGLVQLLELKNNFIINQLKNK
jgi:DNA-directed RNA polymerase alpha subunit